MSNCIELHNHVVVFTKDNFDMDKFLQVAREHEGHPEAPSVGEDFDLFCWFLRRNHTVKDGTLTIAFGRGASSHTRRDFRQTIWFLNQFIKQPVAHTFQVADEMDDFNGMGSLTVRWPYESCEDLYHAV